MRHETDILIVGGGPAGLSAASAAAPHANVTIVDDNPNFGGQIWRAELGKTKFHDAKRLIDAISSKSVRTLPGTQVFGAGGPGNLLVVGQDGRSELAYNKLVIATGARERFLPFPGWTLPGVLGAGGLQALVKSGLDIKGKRVVIAGTGPLLLAVADYLKTKGAEIVLIAEQTSGTNIRRFARGLWRSPAKLIQGAALKARLLGIPYKTDSWVTSCESPPARNRDTSSTKLTVTIKDHSHERRIEADYLACGFHLVPNVELASLLGCKITNCFVAVDHLQQTSVQDVFCAGEPTGIGGLESSRVEGQIAGLAAAGRVEEAGRLQPQTERGLRFTRQLDRTFALRDELRGIAAGDTLVCRCEDVPYSRLAAYSSFREAKLQTRCGMGPCQGRVCGPAAQFLFGWDAPAVRPPLFPVKMEDL